MLIDASASSTNCPGLPFLVLLKFGRCVLQTNFPSLESLIDKIHEDGRIAEKALDLPL